MRSQLMIFSMISLAVAGCGKDVQKNGGAAQVNPTGVLGQCGDPIAAPNAPAIARFTDQAKAGTYRLVSFDAVGMALPANSASAVAPNGISVVSGSVQAGGQPTYVQRCQDLRNMPQSSFSWNVAAPAAIAAESGMIAESIAFAQTVHGPNVLGPNQQQVRPEEGRATKEMARGCRSADAAIRGEGCAPAAYYQLDASTIGVLSTAESRDPSGAIVRTKIYAKYVLDGAGAAPTAGPYPADGTGFSGFGEKDDEFDSGDDYAEYETRARPKPASAKSDCKPCGKRQVRKGKGSLAGVEVRVQEKIVPQKVVAYVPGRSASAPAIVGVRTIVLKEERVEPAGIDIRVAGDAKVKLKDKDRSKTKSKTRTVTVVEKANGDVVTTTTTAKAKEKHRSKTKLKIKAD